MRPIRTGRPLRAGPDTDTDYGWTGQVTALSQMDRSIHPVFYNTSKRLYQ